MRVTSTALFLLALAGCGGGPRPDPVVPTFDRPTAEIPAAALGIPPPSPALRALSSGGQRPGVIDDPDDPRLYEALVTLSGPRAFTMASEARSDWAIDRLEPDEDAPLPRCASGACGTATLPVGAPAEAAIWLALLDLHWHGEGVNRSMVRAAEDGDARSTVGTTRQILRFEAGAGISCAAQQKVFNATAEPMTSASDRVVADHQTAHRIDAQRLPTASIGTGHGQLLLRQRRDGGRHVLELHVALDHAQPQDAEVVDAVLVCHGPKPIDPTALTRHRWRIGRDPAGQWSAVVVSR